MTSSFVIESRVGRLIEARVFRLRTVEEATEYSLALGRAVEASSSARPVLCADHRPVVIYPQDVSDRLTELFVRMNARLERVAIVVAPSNATLALQLNRIVREARYERRRIFQDAADAARYLLPALDGAEAQRAREFLDEFRQSKSPPGSPP
jgi:hypothetical protein